MNAGAPFPGESWIGPPMTGARIRVPTAAEPVGPRDLADRLDESAAFAHATSRGRVAVAVGSRGIARLDELIAEVTAAIRRRGGDPMIVPAMGSHGGGSFTGQAAVLESLGITADALGAPVTSPGPSVRIGTVAAAGAERGLYVPRDVLTADGLVVVNRVKPHTSFDGRIGSGLCKMIAVGLGGPAAARSAHGDGPAALGPGIEAIAEALIGGDALPRMAGVAVVEDAVGRWAELEVIAPSQWIEREEQLVRRAAEWMGRLPVPRLDLLIVERIGKEISGTGMDTHVIGRRRLDGVPDPPGIEIDRIVCCSLSEASHGNATGVGLADAVPRRLIDAMDRDATLGNVRASGFSGRATLPPVHPTERDAVQAMMEERAASAGARPDPARVGVIRDTLHIETVYLSEPAMHEARDVVRRFARLPGIPFNERGRLALEWPEEDA